MVNPDKVVRRVAGDQSGGGAAQDPNDWVRRLEAFGLRLLEPSTTETTRSQGKQLVLISILTFLLSSNLLAIKEASVIAITVEPSERLDVAMLAGAACAYFLIIYCFDLYRDVKTNYYRRLPTTLELLDLKKDIAHRDVKRQRRYARLKSVIERKEATRKRRLELIQDPPPSIALDVVDEDAEEAAGAAQQERLSQWEAFDKLCESDGLDVLRDERAALAFDGVGVARAEALVSALRTRNRLNRWRTVIEFVVPISLALVAIGRVVELRVHR